MRILIALLWAASLGTLAYAAAIHFGLAEKYIQMWVTMVTLIAFVSVYVPRWKIFALAAAIPVAHGLATLLEIALSKATYSDLVVVLILDTIVIAIMLFPLLVLGRNFEK